MTSRRECSEGRFWELSTRTCVLKKVSRMEGQMSKTRKAQRHACIHDPRRGVVKCIGKKKVGRLMEDRERLDGGQQAGLVHHARTRARREVQGKEWKTAQN